MPALRIEGLATSLIGPVSFDIAAGECVALMGTSGAGKSLLLRAIVDLDPSIGNVSVGDRVRLSELGRERCPRIAAEGGLVVGFSVTGNTVHIRFDGHRTLSPIHVSYLELAVPDEARVKRS